MMTINNLIAELQTVAASMPCGGEEEARIKVTKQVSDTRLEESYWGINGVVEAHGVYAHENKNVAMINASHG